MYVKANSNTLSLKNSNANASKYALNAIAFDPKCTARIAFGQTQMYITLVPTHQVTWFKVTKESSRLAGGDMHGRA